MKKTTTSNPLKFFNDAKEARNKSFNKSLPKKGEGGRTMGPMTQQEADAETAATSYPGPYAIPTPTWSSQAKELASKAVSEISKPTNMLGTNVERINNLMREGASSENAYRNMIADKQITRKPKPQYVAPEYEYKKGGTHKMPKSKVMLNSAMKKKTSKKK